MAMRKRKKRLAVEMNVRPGDMLLIGEGKGRLRLEIPRHISVKRRRKRAD